MAGPWYFVLILNGPGQAHTNSGLVWASKFCTRWPLSESREVDEDKVARPVKAERRSELRIWKRGENGAEFSNARGSFALPYLQWSKP